MWGIRAEQKPSEGGGCSLLADRSARSTVFSRCFRGSSGARFAIIASMWPCSGSSTADSRSLQLWKPNMSLPAGGDGTAYLMFPWNASALWAYELHLENAAPTIILEHRNRPRTCGPTFAALADDSTQRLGLQLKYRLGLKLNVQLKPQESKTLSTETKICIDSCVCVCACVCVSCSTCTPQTQKRLSTPRSS